MKKAMLVFLGLYLITFLGCGSSESNIPKKLIGKQCTIQFASASVSGIIKKIDSDWVVVTTSKPGRDLFYIPMKSILLIEKHKEK